MGREETLSTPPRLKCLPATPGEGVAEDEMVGWHHRFNGRESEQTPGDGEGQGSLACCSSWGCKELDMTEQRNNNNSDFEGGGYRM